ncbi:hypothetical protein BJ742DRAFT_291473 [Cladochytrium replicatum]|nr:hypothetical protein BJ742DRAFT_291473 [Cladochytrium replicatum]
MAFSGWADYARQKQAKQDRQNVELAQSQFSPLPSKGIAKLDSAHTANTSQFSTSPADHAKAISDLRNGIAPPPQVDVDRIPNRPTTKQKGILSPFILGSPASKQRMVRSAFTPPPPPGITADLYKPQPMPKLIQMAAVAAVSSGSTGTDTNDKRASIPTQSTTDSEPSNPLTNNTPTIKPSKPVFYGLVFYIDGWTGFAEFSFQQVREMSVCNGAVLRDRDSSQVTHIIATNMTHAKMQKIKKPVVHPKWIWECNAQKKLLPWTSFRTFATHSTTQKTLTTDIAVSPARVTTSKQSESNILHKEARLDEPSISSADRQLEDLTLSPRPNQISTASHLDNVQMHGLMWTNVGTSVGFAESPAKSIVTQQILPTTDDVGEVDRVESERGNESNDEDDGEIESWWGPNRPSIDMNGQWAKENSSTAPGFLEKFYQQSRLHYLSTWKSDLQKWVKEQTPKVSRMVFPEIFQQQQPAELVEVIMTATRRVIMHVDLDCFFASVSILKDPRADEIRSTPVAVAHSAGSSGASTSEIASCNYPARAFGIRNGMSVGRARTLCPNLTVIPYQFELYMSTSQQFFKILLRYSDALQVVSCDEAYLDVSHQITKIGEGMELALANRIREEVRVEAGVPASIGIAENQLLARMATKRAKPDGAWFCEYAPGTPEIMEMLREQGINALPGVGWSLTAKLESAGFKTCGDLAKASLGLLQREHGVKTGKMLYDACRGIDQRDVKSNPVRQSISANVNWGVRFDTPDQVQSFMENLAGEVSARMVKHGLKGKRITLTCKRKRYEGEPAKVLGHGDCDNLSRSANLAFAANDRKLIFSNAWTLLKELNVHPVDVRGLGISATKLVEQSAQDAEMIPPMSIKDHFAALVGNHTHSDGSDNSSKSPQRSRTTVPTKRVFVQLESDEEEDEFGFITKNRPPKQQHDQNLSANHHLRTGGIPFKIHANAKNSDPVSGYLPPTASQIDPQVLAELPEGIRKELSAQIHRPPNAPQKPEPILRTALKRKRQPGNSTAKGTTSAAPVVPAVGNMKATISEELEHVPTPSQVDPRILAELPKDIRKELDSAMRRKRKLFGTSNAKKPEPAAVPVPTPPTEDEADMPVDNVLSEVIPLWISTALVKERRLPEQSELDRIRQYTLQHVEDSVEDVRRIVVCFRSHVDKAVRKWCGKGNNVGEVEEKWLQVSEELRTDAIAFVEAIYQIPVKRIGW